MHFAFQNASSDETRRFLLLQNAAFCRCSAAIRNRAFLINELEAEPLKSAGVKAIEEIFPM